MAATADTAMPGPVAAAPGRRPAPAAASSTCPTLVLHSRGDRMNNFDESRYLAANIPGARLVALESNNHIVLEDEPAWPILLREVTTFVAPDRAETPRRRGRDRRSRVLSAREMDVLRLAAEGHDNDGDRRRRCTSQRAHGRAAPAEHLRQARPAGQVGPHRRRHAAALQV